MMCISLFCDVKNTYMYIYTHITTLQYDIDKHLTYLSIFHDPQIPSRNTYIYITLNQPLAALADSTSSQGLKAARHELCEALREGTWLEVEKDIPIKPVTNRYRI